MRKLNWIDCGLPYMSDSYDKPCFYYSGLMRPGIMFELDSGEKVLIGHMNSFAGIHSDSGSLERHERRIVVRYTDVLE